MKKVIIITSVSVGVLIVGLVGMSYFQGKQSQKVIELFQGMKMNSLSLNDKIILFKAYSHETMQVEMIDVAIAIGATRNFDGLSPKERKIVVDEVAVVLDGIPGSESGDELRKKLS